MAPKNKLKSVEEQYKKYTQKEHIIERPDSYLGELKHQTEKHYIFKDDKIIKSEITYSPGLNKIIDEILVNARDHHISCPSCNKLWVSINDNIIAVKNNGTGIPIEIHKEHNIYIVELIFNELLTSSNYDDTEQRITGGRNGYGAKLTNIFSLSFTVETVDDEKGLKYIQTFSKNMSEKTKPNITKTKEKGYTKVTFEPDLEKFGMTELTEDILGLIKRRVYDIAGTHDKLKVYLNDNEIKVNTFKKYIELHQFSENNQIIHEIVNNRWEVAAIYDPEYGASHISFVNGIYTSHGGNHVDYVLNNVISRLKEILVKKNKGIDVKPAVLKENLIFFVRAVIVNPSFTSQTKEMLKTKNTDFGSTCHVSDAFITKLSKTGIFDKAIKMAKLNEETILEKNDKKNKNSKDIKNLPKYEKANFAGTAKSEDAILFLVEGDSAKTLVMSGRSVQQKIKGKLVNGSDIIGVFPLKGKLLNVREATKKQLLENEEINNIKRIIGLQHGKVYKDSNDLRYGKIVILTDADQDGFHIQGLLINFFHAFFPSILDLEILHVFNTPIVKAISRTETLEFYNLTDYDNWQKNTDTKNFKIKYYKGLGTSTSVEAKEYFVNLFEKLVKYISDDKEKTDIAVELAFKKENANDRKVWLYNYNKENILSNDNKTITIDDFIHKRLIHFSNYDNERSIPNICDGFKPSQRKIFYDVVKNNIYNNDIKVAQLAGYVSAETGYHHGEASLIGAIINMAQNYVGSNNINILTPNGQFGTRLQGGKDHASARYIFTRINEIIKYIFKTDDNYILNYLTEDNLSIEPEWYIPIIPMVLVNGVNGIGTGFSTTIPSYNPLDLVENQKLLIEGKKCKKIKPWYQGFKGTIDEDDDKKNSYFTTGIIEQINDVKVKITELPIGIWTTDYKEFIEKEIDSNNFIIKYSANNTDINVEFELYIKDLHKYLDNGTLYNKLKLVSKLNTTNMHLYNEKGVITKYETVTEIQKEFYKTRLETYKKRKEYLINKLKYEVDKLKYQMLYIKGKLDKIIIVDGQEEEIIVEKFKELSILEMGKDFQAIDKNYDYIWHMDQRSCTLKKIEELQKKLDNKSEELENLINLTVQEMWINELDEFIEQYNKLNIVDKKKKIK
jgi:DNA topoisomerase-2